MIQQFYFHLKLKAEKGRGWRGGFERTRAEQRAFKSKFK
jgi:hypothetical protein